MSKYLPIAEHGVIGNLHTVALVGTDGNIGFCCWPRFDSPSVFASVLDAENGGHWRIEPIVASHSVKQLYIPDTNVLITRFLTPDGVGELQDFMPIHRDVDARRHLVRRVMVVRGTMRFRMSCQPRLNYGRDEHVTDVGPHGALFTAPDFSLAVSGTVPVTADGRGITAEFELEQGKSAAFSMYDTDDGSQLRRLREQDTEADFHRTVRYWRGWLAKSRYRGRWREMVNRSALTLKLLTYRPTGAIVAAPTTSLPEQIGGPRNWDYRYTWIRDAAFSVYALLRLGFTDEAAEFMKWLTARFRESDGLATGPLQIMYGIDGRTHLPEYELEHFEGYEQSTPVRVGNGAATQLQLDIYGELIDSVYLYNKYGEPIGFDAWKDLTNIVDWVCENWDQPDEGVWETRGGRKNFTYSRLMCWVAIERAVRMARYRGLPGDHVRWMNVRDQITEQILERGWNDKRQAFVQSYESDVLDASLLLMPMVKFVAPKDPRWLSTLDAIGEELVSDSLVYRYNVSAAPDGLSGDEGTFSICSFWYVEALSRAGRLDEARLAFEKMLTYANHVGLYSEEIGASGELLGNFPQAFTHLALISAATNLDAALG